MKKKDANFTSRREFLKLSAIGAASALLHFSCKQPLQKAIPYVIQPEELIPGKSLYYATHYYNGIDFGNLLIKTRDGRPIKIEGNPHCKRSNEATTARLQASLLSLYNPDRIAEPSYSQQPISYNELDEKVVDQLNKLKQQNHAVAFITPTIISKTQKVIIDKFIDNYPNIEHVTYDIFSYSSIREAYKLLIGKPIIPEYHIDKSKLIVAFGADFLGTWLDVLTASSQYGRFRDSGNTHVQFEDTLSLTGSNAHERFVKTETEQTAFLESLYNYIAEKISKPKIRSSYNPTAKEWKILRLIYSKRKACLILSGSNSLYNQLLTAKINFWLKNHEKTLTLSNYKLFSGSNYEKENFLKKLKQEYYKGIISYNTDFLYDNSFDPSISQIVQNTDFTLDLSFHPNLTNSQSKYVCPDNHYFESWRDAEAYENVISFAQPVINPLLNTRQFEETLLRWCGIKITFKNWFESYWKTQLKINFEDKISWQKIIQKGIYELPLSKKNKKVELISVNPENYRTKTDEQNFAVVLKLIPSIYITLPEHSNNFWLQELPDPLTKICWDNYTIISENLAQQNKLENGDIIRINDKIELPVYILPGQHSSTLSIYYGYGNSNAGSVSENVGFNALLLTSLNNGIRSDQINVHSIKKTRKKYELATTQKYDFMNDDFVKEVSQNETLPQNQKTASLYPEREYRGNKWGMVIDLNKCTGCHACVIACQAENNIPVVGKEEILRGHDMQWLRIDRYFKKEGGKIKTLRQPVMCQHCENAPCENVCPVMATTHSSEGINQMVYNRCIGTRYCNNNCPYKVRSFNWYDYNGADSIQNNEKDPCGQTSNSYRLILNPDVTVRAKGVIEKCSFCYQRIAEKKIQAKKENRQITEHEILPACAQACPTKAIQFGNTNDNTSQIAKEYESKRQYQLLEHLGTNPSVKYLAVIKQEIM